MDDLQSPVTSLLSHCTQCDALCCKNDFIVLTEREYTRITDGGHADHLVPVTIPEGTFYVLNFKIGACPYLGENNRCTIEAEKPDTCRAYPVTTQTNRYGEMTGTGIGASTKSFCRAAAFTADEFIRQAKDILAARLEEIPWATERKVSNLFCDTLYKDILRDQTKQNRDLPASAVFTLHYNDQ